MVPINYIAAVYNLPLRNEIPPGRSRGNSWRFTVCTLAFCEFLSGSLFLLSSQPTTPCLKSLIRLKTIGLPACSRQRAACQTGLQYLLCLRFMAPSNSFSFSKPAPRGDLHLTGKTAKNKTTEISCLVYFFFPTKHAYTDTR